MGGGGWAYAALKSQGVDMELQIELVMVRLLRNGWSASMQEGLHLLWSFPILACVFAIPHTGIETSWWSRLQHFVCSNLPMLATSAG